jgi:hypothetical protein
MKSKSPWLIGAGVAAIGVVAGITYAVMQPEPQPSPEVSSSPTASSTAQPTPQPSVSPTTSTASPPVDTAQTPVKAVPNQVSNTQAPAKRNLTKCVTSMAVVADPESPLNVRSSPTTNGDNVVGQLKNGTFVSVSDQQDGWLQITDPMQGWIAKNRTESGCNQKTEEVRFAASANSATIRDRFIGTGSHEYVFQANQGQTMTLAIQDGPLPAVFAPDGKVINSPSPDDNRSNWSDTLPTTGEYRVVLDSNYKGYDYSFTVKIQ